LAVRRNDAGFLKLKHRQTLGPLSRREWLVETLALLAAGCASGPTQDRAALSLERADRIETVTGPVAADRLGVTLMHEHILVDFIGAAQVNPSRYDADAVFTAFIPALKAAGFSDTEVQQLLVKNPRLALARASTIR
jgi:hypothetical protein